MRRMLEGGSTGVDCCLAGMDEEQKLLRSLARQHTVLRLTTDPRAERPLMTIIDRLSSAWNRLKQKGIRQRPTRDYRRISNVREAANLRHASLTCYAIEALL